MKTTLTAQAYPPKSPARSRRHPGYSNEGWLERRAQSREAQSSLPAPDSPLSALDLAPFVTAIRGRVGNVVFKTYGRKIIVTRVPCFDGYVPSAAQRARRDRMRDATACAKRVYADAAAKAFYIAAARKLGRQPFRLAVSDYLSGHARMKAVERLLHYHETESTPVAVAGGDGAGSGTPVGRISVRLWTRRAFPAQGRAAAAGAAASKKSAP